MITKTKQAKKTRMVGTFDAQARLQAFRKSPKYKTFFNADAVEAERSVDSAVYAGPRSTPAM